MSRIKQLSQCLVDKFGLTEQESSEFVIALFEIIRERLLADNLVKVKGLGTFKLSEMNARESVDVNTGERITIEGRYKLSFTPENAVRDRINSPFSSFESIDLDEEVDFSVIDRKYEEEGKAVEPNPEPNPEATPEASVEPIVEPIAETTPEATPEASVEPIAEPIAETTPEASVEPTAESAPEPTAEITPEPIVEPSSELVAESTSENSSTVRAPYCEELIRTDMDHSRTIITLLKWLLGLVVFLILCVGGYMAYNIGRDSGLFNKEVAKTPESQLAKPQIEEMIVSDSVKAEEEKDTLVVDSLKKQEEKPEVKDENQIPDQSLYNKDVRVRTGAYYIMGLDREVIVQKGQTFAGICKAYLGEGMECYVEVFNGGITDAKPGDKIKIPKVKHRKSFRKKK